MLNFVNQFFKVRVVSDFSCFGDLKWNPLETFELKERKQNQLRFCGKISLRPHSRAHFRPETLTQTMTLQRFLLLDAKLNYNMYPIHLKAINSVTNF